MGAYRSNRWALIPSRHHDNKLTNLSRQGLPHQSTSDDLYNDYLIPANSVVIPNLW